MPGWPLGVAFLAMVTASTSPAPPNCPAGCDGCKCTPIAIDPGVKRVHYVTLHHLDIGWDDSIHNVLEMYLNASGSFEWRNSYAPGSRSTQPSGLLDRALDVIDALTARGGRERLVLTTWSYLIKMYLDCPPSLGLECPSKARVARMERAIRRGDISYHANPLNSEDEAYDAHTLAAAIDVSHTLDGRFGRANRSFIGQEDDPGSTRGVIPVLAGRGVKGMYVGYNDGSMNLTPLAGAPRSLQTITHGNGAHSTLFGFNWVDRATDTSAVALIHTSGHGGTDVGDGIVFDNLATNTLVLGDLAIAIRGSDDTPPGSGPSQIWCDNATAAPCKRFGHGDGTPIDSIVADFAQLARWFPKAEVVASDFDSWLLDLGAGVAKLPKFEGEVGDTWCYGLGSDPYKAAAGRAIGRARARYLQQANPVLDGRYRNFSLFFAKHPEETWGEKTLCHDETGPRWCANDVWNASAQCNPVSAASWAEQRKIGLELPLEALKDHPLSELVRSELEAVKRGEVEPPDTVGMERVDDARSVPCGQSTLRFDSTGALQMVDGTEVGQLFQFEYHSYSDAEIDAVSEEYGTGGEEYFGGGCNSSRSQTVLPSLKASWVEQHNSSRCSVVMQLALGGNVTVDYGAPSSLWLQVDAFVYGGLSLNVTLTVINKRTTRRTESAALRVAPSAAIVDTRSLELHKVASWISPLEVAQNGSKHIHYMSDSGGARWNNGAVELHSMDAGLVAVGSDARPVPTVFHVASPGATPIPLAPSAPVDVEHGLSINLWNNLWNTNYVQWYPFEQIDRNFKYRLTLKVQS